MYNSSNKHTTTFQTFPWGNCSRAKNIPTRALLPGCVTTTCVQPPLRNFVEFPSRFNEISDDCCGKFVVDFAEMEFAHDTVSDVSDIGAKFDDSIDFLDQNQTVWMEEEVICRLDWSTLPHSQQLSRLDTSIYLSIWYPDSVNLDNNAALGKI